MLMSKTISLSQYRVAMDVALLMLGLGKSFTLVTFIHALEQYRRRRIRLLPEDDLPAPNAAIMFAAPTYDLICYQAGLSQSHTQQILCHALVHLLYNHR